MDRKIVSHLKVHLNKRLQKRLDQQDDRFEYPSDEEGGRDKRPSIGRTGQMTGYGDSSIFSNYSETGEKIQEGRKAKASKSPRRSNHGGQRPSLTSASLGGGGGGQSSREDSTAEEISANAAFRKMSPLPGIPVNNWRDSQPNGENGVHMNGNGVGENGEISAEDVHLQTVDDDDVEVENLDFQSTDVSPVQTPVASRPQSRVDTNWATLTDGLDKASEMLSGAVHIPCPPDRAILNLYIAAGYSDTEAERFFMQEHLYPVLRAHCMHHGHELRVHDLHWGFKDAIVDDHRMPDVMRKVIAEVQDTMHGLNFVVSV
ncbi:NACHT and WD repeat domain-containing protein 1 [Elysia marginata]|uniref:NACHT and WD repeat domain-containing protein 1 n=1 Tax=Elysia marginata TaxID=1093978 RepID=A0AAV4FHW7_9GAST|nr:NACHT and WD repeat domain-containing protein 1 [Elysia marginata]